MVKKVKVRRVFKPVLGMEPRRSIRVTEPKKLKPVIEYELLELCETYHLLNISTDLELAKLLEPHLGLLGSGYENVVKSIVDQCLQGTFLSEKQRLVLDRCVVYNGAIRDRVLYEAG